MRAIPLPTAECGPGRGTDATIASGRWVFDHWLSVDATGPDRPIGSRGHLFGRGIGPIAVRAGAKRAAAGIDRRPDGVRLKTTEEQTDS